MPPTQTNLVPHYARQYSGSVPSCVATCMSSGNTTGCSGVTDYTCVCASTAYVTSVSECFSNSCTAAETAVGQTYSESACAYYGVSINATSTSTTTDNSTATAEVSSTASAVLSAPVTYSHAYINIQAIFSSICGALLLLALVSGFISCRARYRRERAFTQSRTWTGVGSTMVGGNTQATGGGKSKMFASRNVDPTATFMSDNFGATSSNFGGTTVNGGGQGVSFGGAFGAAGAYSAGPSYTNGNGGFTNRLPVGEEEDSKSEGYELGDLTKKSSIRESIKEEEEGLDSPTTSKGPGSEVDLDGSTVHLNRLNKDHAY
ncbi:hypothetical protein L202_03535 [Cryptococcus amylolentus CBS 6039]|uniref:CFEM domain-containing protein n=1 Tax=Cryptococcus amylolentus CBS 6039 TaxID=1295533 RepID=A0A1E3HT99_9TREE|nr:hypothetical protein L202_03535 [Cryptococcus amylolentus CBS 6039]ODN79588.1 hypothetical protein L202_03535 [Cryptococcus amylolentus CBS 6039]